MVKRFKVNLEGNINIHINEANRERHKKTLYFVLCICLVLDQRIVFNIQY